MFDAEGTLTESSKFMWVKLDVAGWFRLLSASDIWRWWFKDAICTPLNFECFCGRSTALRSFRENWRQAIYRCRFSSRSGLTALFFLIEDQQQKPRPTKTCPVDFYPVANAYTRSGHQLFVSASLPSKMEPLVSSFHQACVSRTLCRISPGIWHHL